MPIDEETKRQMTDHVQEFLSQLFEMAEFDPESVTDDHKNQFNSQIRVAMS